MSILAATMLTGLLSVPARLPSVENHCHLRGYVQGLAREDRRMPLSAKDFRQYIVRPVLQYLDPEIPYSQGAEDLIMGTAAQESHLMYLDQLTPGPGPAFGLFQMERATEKWLWESYVQKDPILKSKFESLLASYPSDRMEQMRCNLAYAAGMARMRYMVVKEPIPQSIDGIAAYYKKYYNTYKGKATVAEFLLNYKKYIG